MSGNSSSPWIFNSRPELSFEKYAELAGASTQSELKSKMIEMDFDDLRQLEMGGWLSEEKFYFILSVGDPVIPYHPYSQKGMENIMDIPYMLGRTNDEGGYSMSFYHHQNFFSGLSRNQSCKFLASFQKVSLTIKPQP